MSMLATDPKKDSATDYECNVVTMEDKLYMIKQYEKVENVQVLGLVLGLSQSTVSNIIHDSKHILAYDTGKTSSLDASIINILSRIYTNCQMFVVIVKSNHKAINNLIVYYSLKTVTKMCFIVMAQ